MTESEMKVELGGGMAAYMAAADETTAEHLASDDRLVAAVREYDEYFRNRLWLRAGADSISLVLFLNAYQMFLAGVRTALGGHTAAVFPLLRTALESAAYGGLIAAKPELSSIWRNRHHDDEAKRACRNFRLYVSPPKAGAFADALNAATTEKAVEALVKALATSHAKLKKPPACEANVQAFLTADAGQRFALVKNTSVISTDADPVDAIRAIFSPTVSPLILDLVCERAIGAAKEAGDRLIRAGKTAIIDCCCLPGGAAGFRSEEQPSRAAVLFHRDAADRGGAAAHGGSPRLRSTVGADRGRR